MSAAALAPGTTFEAAVERLAYGGDGVARVDGLVAFVPWTAPGDRVRARVVEERERYVRGRLEAVLEPGPARVEPGCPVYGDCGGCRLQHLAPEAQRRAKARAVADALARIGGVDGLPPVTCAPAAAAWHYRQRAVLTWRVDEGDAGRGPRLGFHAAGDPHRVVPIHACPILAQAGNRRLAGLRRGLESGLAASGVKRAEGRLAVRVLPGGETHAGVFARTADGGRELARVAERHANLPVTWGTWRPERGGRLELAQDAPRLERWFDYRGLSLRAGFDSFLQVDLEAASALYDAVLEDLAVRPGEHVVDAYAGIGIVTCHLSAAGARVTAVEAHSGAAADLRANAARVAGDVHVLEIPVDRLDWRRPRPAAVVLNPPRAGCHPRSLKGIGGCSATRIVYVSCDPTTLARDLKRLGPAWRLSRVRAFDVFPQTAHVETVVSLRRAESA